jgi:hypothetical protein
MSGLPPRADIPAVPGTDSHSSTSSAKMYMWLVSQALAFGRFDRGFGPFAIGRLPAVPAKFKFPQVPMQMLGADMVKCDAPRRRRGAGSGGQDRGVARSAGAARTRRRQSRCQTARRDGGRWSIRRQPQKMSSPACRGGTTGRRSDQEASRRPGGRRSACLTDTTTPAVGAERRRCGIGGLSAIRSWMASRSIASTSGSSAMLPSGPWGRSGWRRGPRRRDPDADRGDHAGSVTNRRDIRLFSSVPFTTATDCGDLTRCGHSTGTNGRAASPVTGRRDA